MPPAWVDPCNGHFTHELTRGKCPLEIVSSNRLVNAGRRSANVRGVLPTNLRDTVSATDLAYLNIVDHNTDVAFDFENASVQELFNAAKSGIVNAGDAMAELGGRIPAAAADVQSTIGHTISALENLVKVGQIVKNPNQVSGNFLRLWACVTKKMKRLSGPVVVVEGTTLTLEAGETEGEKQRPAKFTVDRMLSERLFDACVYQWSLLTHTLGIMAFEVSASFVFDTCYTLRVRHSESFWTAQEYFIACLDLLDQGKVKADKVIEFDRSVMLADARRFGEMFEAKATRSGPSDKGGSSKRWNGECQPCDSTKVAPCPYFNAGKEHDPKHLGSSGKCVFRHVCNHWVSNKGPGGRCESPDHPRTKCDNPNKCDKRVE